MQLYELTEQEQKFIIEYMIDKFPNRNNVLLIHEGGIPYLSKVDVGVLYSKEEENNCIIFTIGMSAYHKPMKKLLSDYHCLEVYIEVPRDIIIGNPAQFDVENINKKYHFIIDDLFRISKMPASSEEFFLSGDTLELLGKYMGIIDILWDYKSITQFFQLVYLTEEELNSIKDQTRKVRLDKIKEIAESQYEKFHEVLDYYN